MKIRITNLWQADFDFSSQYMNVFAISWQFDIYAKRIMFVIFNFEIEIDFE